MKLLEQYTRIPNAYTIDDAEEQQGKFCVSIATNKTRTVLVMPYLHCRYCHILAQACLAQYMFYYINKICNSNLLINHKRHDTATERGKNGRVDKFAVSHQQKCSIKKR